MYCGDNDTFYAIRETIPGEPVYQIAEVETIPQNIELAALVLEDGEIKVDIDKFRASRFAEVNSTCEKAIYKGIDVETSKESRKMSLGSLQKNRFPKYQIEFA